MSHHNVEILCVLAMKQKYTRQSRHKVAVNGRAIYILSVLCVRDLLSVGLKNFLVG